MVDIGLDFGYVSFGWISVPSWDIHTVIYMRVNDCPQLCSLIFVVHDIILLAASRAS